MACWKMWIVGACKFLVEFYALWYTRAMDRAVLFYDCNDAALAPIYPSYSPPWVCMVKRAKSVVGEAYHGVRRPLSVGSLFHQFQ